MEKINNFSNKEEVYKIGQNVQNAEQIKELVNSIKFKYSKTILKPPSESEEKQESIPKSKDEEENDGESFLSFLNDADIKAIYSNHQRVSSIIILQCLYYFNIFKSLFQFKCRTGKALDEENLNILNNLNNLSPPLKSRKSVPLIRMASFIVNRQTNKDITSISSDDLNLPIISRKLSNVQKSDKIVTDNFKVGIIGCGTIGSELAKHLIAIKDYSKLNFKIIISTRRPDQVHPDILSSIDENIEVVLDNERVFNEAHLIFLCVLPHSLDLILKEITYGFKERIEKIKKKRNLFYPTIVSTLSAVTVERLKSIFPEEVNVQRTYVFPKKFTKNKIYRLDSINRDTKVKKVYGRFKIDTLKYSEEAASHLFVKKENILDYLLSSFHSAFYLVKRKSQSEVTKYNFSFEEYLLEVIKTILLNENLDKLTTFFDLKSFKVKEDSKDLIIRECRRNFLVVVSNLFENINN